MTAVDTRPSETRPSGQTGRRPSIVTAIPPHEAAAEWLLAAVSVAVIVSFTRLFEGGTFVWPLVVLAGATHLWLAVARRRGYGLLVSAVVSIVGYAVLASWLLFGSTTRWLVPTPNTAHAAGQALTQSWHAFQQVVAPAKPLNGFVLVASLALCFGIFLADWAAFRLWAPLEALVPSITLFGFTAFMGTNRIQVFATTLYATAALLFVLEHRVAQRERTTTWLANQVSQGSSWLIKVGVTTVLVASVAGLILGPRLPGAGEPGLIHLRGSGPGSSARVTISPLVDIKNKLVSQADTTVFVVDSTQPAYWRLTSLDTFDGTFWRSSGRYDSVSGNLSGALPKGIPDPGARNDVTQTFTIMALDQLWLPAAYVPVSVSPQGFQVRYHSGSSTLIVDTNLPSSNNQTYQVKSVLPRYTAAELEHASAVMPSSIRSQDLAVPGLSANAKSIAASVTAGARTPYDKAMALQRYFRNPALFHYDTSVDFHNDTNAIDTFLRVRRGYCQQFAGTFAALARSVGLPTRVAVGFTPGTHDSANSERYVVKGVDAHAWPEVYLGQYGWVPFEPTPGRGAPGEQGYLGIPPAQANPGGEGTVTIPTSTVPVTSPTSSLPTTRPNSRLRTEQTQSTTSHSTSTDVGSWIWIGLLALLGLALGYALAVPSVAALERRRRRSRAHDPAARVQVAWLDSEEQLTLLGTARRADETTREFADRAAQRLPTHRTGLTALAGSVDAAVFGAAPLDDVDATAAEDTTARLTAAVSDQVPWWRRAVVQLDPRRLRLRGTTRRA
jgi:transglutaminase-like putative cysteine protease